MIAKKADLTINRGASFDIELIGQQKDWIYDPDVHNDPADLKRTHAENLEYYGYTYSYINFLGLYPTVELIVKKSWIKSGELVTDNLMKLTNASEITLTARSIQIALTATETRNIDFDSGTYELMLTTAGGKKELLMYGNLLIEGEKN